MKKLVRSSSNILGMAKMMSRGVFWIVDNKLLAFPFSDNMSDGIAKSGLTYNHKKLWQHVKPKGCNKPYNYYPRGRVDFTNKGKPIIYMNPNIDGSYLPEIRTRFGLREIPEVKYDNSFHYLCYLDEDNARKATGYEAAVTIWMDTYGGEDKFTYDKEGFPIMPDYSQL